MPRRHSTTVSVDIEVSDILADLDDEQLFEELRSRGKTTDFSPIAQSSVRDAYDHLRCNRGAAALAILDRLLFANVFEPAAKTHRAMTFETTRIASPKQ
jgi:hypothetical protein